MALVKISSHQRGRKSAQIFNVNEYTQNRRDGKKRGKGKRRSACQLKIAEVIKLNNPFNATVDQLRNDPKWRSYVCNCTSSAHYDWITGGKDGKSFGAGSAGGKTTSFTFQAPSWGYKKAGQKHPVTIKGRTVTIKGHYAHSHCGVDIFIMAHQRNMTGKQIVRLVSG